MLDVRARKNVSRAVDPIARFVAKVGLSPTVITLTGAAIGIAGAALISLGYLAVGCGVMGFGALLDILDGVLAGVREYSFEDFDTFDAFADFDADETAPPKAPGSWLLRRPGSGHRWPSRARRCAGTHEAPGDRDRCDRHQTGQGCSRRPGCRSARG